MIFYVQLILNPNQDGYLGTHGTRSGFIIFLETLETLSLKLASHKISSFHKRVENQNKCFRPNINHPSWPSFQFEL